MPDRLNALKPPITLKGAFVKQLLPLSAGFSPFPSHLPTID
jgi:hypothetical protein